MKRAADGWRNRENRARLHEAHRQRAADYAAISEPEQIRKRNRRRFDYLRALAELRRDAVTVKVLTHRYGVAWKTTSHALALARREAGLALQPRRVSAKAPVGVVELDAVISMRREGHPVADIARHLPGEHLPRVQGGARPPRPPAGHRGGRR